MREIRFRAFHPKEGLCNPKKLNELNVSIDAYGDVYFDNMAHELAWILMQYTGLKDRNGNDLYHSDIIWEQTDNIYGEIVWKENGWAIELYEAGEFVDTFVGDDLENFCRFNHLAGNIYENPELLGGGEHE